MTNENEKRAGRQNSATKYAMRNRPVDNRSERRTVSGTRIIQIDLLQQSGGPSGHFQHWRRTKTFPTNGTIEFNIDLHHAELRGDQSGEFRIIKKVSPQVSA